MKRKYLYMLSVVLLFSVMTIGATYATSYFSDKVQIHNVVEAGKIDIGVKEEIEQWKEDVGICIPAETADCWVRVYVSSPTSLDGKTIYEQEKVKDFDQNWTYNEADRYYYYNSKVLYSKEDQILNMFKEISMREEFDKDTANESLKDGNFNVIIYAESVQDTGESSAKDAFAKLK